MSFFFCRYYYWMSVKCVIKFSNVKPHLFSSLQKMFLKRDIFFDTLNTLGLIHSIPQIPLETVCVCELLLAEK